MVGKGRNGTSVGLVRHPHLRTNKAVLSNAGQRRRQSVQTNHRIEDDRPKPIDSIILMIGDDRLMATSEDRRRWQWDEMLGYLRGYLDMGVNRRLTEKLERLSKSQRRQLKKRLKHVLELLESND